MAVSNNDIAKALRKRDPLQALNTHHRQRPDQEF
jgi:hypothetical protein